MSGFQLAKLLQCSEIYNMDVIFFPESIQNFMLQVERFDKDKFLVKVEFVPTVPHCSLATLIGLCIRQKLQQYLPYSCKLDISIAPGTHNIEEDGKSGILPFLSSVFTV